MKLLALALLALPSFAQTKVDYNTQLKNAPIYQITATGAICDGTTNATAKVQQALNTAAGGTVQFPGNSTCSLAPIVVPANTSVVCQAGTILFQRANAAIQGNGFITLGAGASIMGCTIDVNGANQSVGYDAHGINIVSGATNFTITGNIIQNIRGVGIFGPNVGSNGTISNNQILNNCFGTFLIAGRKGIDLRNSTASSTIRNFKILGNTIDNTACSPSGYGGDGIHFGTSTAAANITGVVIAENIVITSGNTNSADPLGIELFADSTGGTITQAVIADNTINCYAAAGSPQMNGISLGGLLQQAGVHGNSYVAITGNKITGCLQPLEILGSHVTVAANNIDNSGAVYINSDGMTPDGLVDINIVGNTFSNSTGINAGVITVFGGSAIGVAPVDGLTISNNQFYLSGTLSYVELSAQYAAMSNISITGNRGYGAKRYGFSIAGIGSGSLSKVTIDDNTVDCTQCTRGTAILWAGNMTNVRKNTVYLNNLVGPPDTRTIPFGMDSAGSNVVFTNNTSFNSSTVATAPLSLPNGVIGANVEFNKYYGVMNDESLGTVTFKSSVSLSPFRLAKNICLLCRTFDAPAPLYIGPDMPFSSNTTSITSASNAATVSLTATAHGLSTGQLVNISGATLNWTPINGQFSVTVTSANTFTIPINSTSFSTLTGSPVVYGLSWGTKVFIEGLGGTSNTLLQNRLSLGVDNNVAYHSYFGTVQNVGGNIWAVSGVTLAGVDGPGSCISAGGRTLFGYSPGACDANDDTKTTIQVNGGARLTSTSFVNFPTCSSTYQGSIRPVSDSTTVIWGATITGGGGSFAMAFCDGTNWTVMGK